MSKVSGRQDLGGDTRCGVLVGIKVNGTYSINIQATRGEITDLYKRGKTDNRQQRIGLRGVLYAL